MHQLQPERVQQLWKTLLNKWSLCDLLLTPSSQIEDGPRHEETRCRAAYHELLRDDAQILENTLLRLLATKLPLHQSSKSRLDLLCQSLQDAAQSSHAVGGHETLIPVDLLPGRHSVISKTSENWVYPLPRSSTGSFGSIDRYYGTSKRRIEVDRRLERPTKTFKGSSDSVNVNIRNYFFETATTSKNNISSSSITGLAALSNHGSSDSIGITQESKNTSFDSKTTSFDSKTTSFGSGSAIFDSRDVSFDSTTTFSSVSHAGGKDAGANSSSRNRLSLSYSFDEWEPDSNLLKSFDGDLTRDISGTGILDEEIEERVSQPLETLTIGDFDSRQDGDPKESILKDASSTHDRTSPVIIRLRSALQNSYIFGESLPYHIFLLPFRVRYELCRVANECNVSLLELGHVPNDLDKDYVKLWQWLRSHPALEGKTLPEKSLATAWDAAETFANATISAELYFVEDSTQSLFKFRLKPLQCGGSHRFGRKFGSDRFLTLDFPSLVTYHLPKWLNPEPLTVRDEIAQWLAAKEFQILGRRWRSFYLEPSKSGQKNEGRAASSIRLFATSESRFPRNLTESRKISSNFKALKPLSIEDLLRWYMDFDLNKNMSSCKAFARFSQGLSKTYPTIVFEPSEIIRVANHRNVAADGTMGEVMDDGCSIISRGAAIRITEKLNLVREFPCAFQGRIGSAKGLWIIDRPVRLFDSFSDSDQPVWIEVNDEQSKFKIPPTQSSHDKYFRIFEVLDWPKPLASASLNLQFLPILRRQGVPRDVLAARLRADLDLKIKELKDAIADPCDFRQWCQDHNPISSERIKDEKIEMHAGMPKSEVEKIIFMIESGFDPRENRYLSKLAWRQCQDYCQKLLTKLKIEIPQSCYCFCVADPLDVLEPDQVHLGFSTQFTTKDRSFQNTILSDRDALVARSPAHFASDIQKVHCVFEPSLAHLKDVVVFSRKGMCSLASKLSGGDYDGDKVWVCWDSEIVNHFENVPPQDSNDLLLTKDSMKLENHSGDNLIESFLSHSFNFALKPDMLGTCTVYKERYCYHKNDINSDSAKMLSALVSNLVDARKQGILFSEDDWALLKASQELPAKLKKPAYEIDLDEKPMPKLEHINDFLMFGVAKPAVESLKTDFYNELREACDGEACLSRKYNRYEEIAAKEPDGELKRALKCLVEEIKQVKDKWTLLSAANQSDQGKRSYKMSYSAKVTLLFDQYQAIRPVSSEHPLVKEWNESIDSSESEWEKLKASATFKQFQWSTTFPYEMAGKELGDMMARQFEGSRTVVKRVHTSLKSDPGYNSGLKAKRSASALRPEGKDDDD